MTHTCNSSPWEAEAGEAHKFHTSLGYVARPYLNTKTKELIQDFLSFLYLVSWILYGARRKELCSTFLLSVSSIYFDSSVLFKKLTGGPDSAGHAYNSSTRETKAHRSEASFAAEQGPCLKKHKTSLGNGFL